MANVQQNMPKAHVISLGCISNIMDGSGYERLIQEAGYLLVKEIRDADLVLINTCAFNQLKEDAAFAAIEHAYHVKKQQADIIVCGCLPDINKERLRSLHQGIMFGPRNQEVFLSFLKMQSDRTLQFAGPISYSQCSPIKKGIYRAKQIANAVPGMSNIPIVRRILSPLFIYDKNVYCLKIESGCWGACTYCAIRFAKGKTQSRSLSDIRAEFAAALQQGYTKFVLAGDEITSYGRDRDDGTTLWDVISQILDEPCVVSLFLESFEPSFMIEDFSRVRQMLGSKKIPVFCSSAQSGSNRILKLMNRRYQAEDYARCMRAIKQEFAGVYLRNEIIVGFPGETEDDFQQTVGLVHDLNLDFIHAYEYEDRPKTAAAQMNDKVSAPEKSKRRKIIQRQHLRNLL